MYARVSSDQQAEAATIDSQVADLQKRIANDGLTLEMEMQFLDEGCSGATLIRPALERLRDMAANGAIDCLCIHSPDRLARKYAYQVLLLDEFQRCGVEVIFLNHRLGQTPEEDLLLQVQGMVAEYERAKIIERSRRGKLHAARQGSVSVFSSAPYGYRYVSCQEGDGVARYEIVPEEASVIRDIFEWIGRDGLSIGAVCRRLKEQRIPSPTGKNYWSRTTVWGYLKHEAYRGSAIFGKTHTGPLRPRLRTQRGSPEQPRRARSIYSNPVEDGICVRVPAIINDALFSAVAERLEENRRRYRQLHRGARYLLQGLIVCGHCGYAFHGTKIEKSGLRFYYRCSGTDRYRFGGERICRSQSVRGDLVEEAVWQDVCLLLENPARIEHEYQRRYEHGSRNAQDDIHLQVRIQKVKRGIARLIDAYEEELVEKSDFELRIRRSRNRLTVLEEQSKQQAETESQQAALRLMIGRFREFADHISSGLQNADWSTRREIIRASVKRVEIDEARVHVIYRIDPLLSDHNSGGSVQDYSRRASVFA